MMKGGRRGGEKGGVIVLPSSPSSFYSFYSFYSFDSFTHRGWRHAVYHHHHHHHAAGSWASQTPLITSKWFRIVIVRIGGNFFNKVLVSHWRWRCPFVHNTWWKRRRVRQPALGGVGLEDRGCRNRWGKKGAALARSRPVENDQVARGNGGASIWALVPCGTVVSWRSPFRYGAGVVPVASLAAYWFNRLPRPRLPPPPIGRPTPCLPLLTKRTTPRRHPLVGLPPACHRWLRGLPPAPSAPVSRRVAVSRSSAVKCATPFFCCCCGAVSPHPAPVQPVQPVERVTLLPTARSTPNLHQCECDNCRSRRKRRRRNKIWKINSSARVTSRQSWPNYARRRNMTKVNLID